jgi:hypothetical protein
MTNTDKLFLCVCESARRDQIDNMLALSKKKGQSPAEWVADAFRFQLAKLPPMERWEFVNEFKEGGIDLEELLS